MNATRFCQILLETLLHSSGSCHGDIATSLRGIAGFGYDPLFIIREYHSTFGELSDMVKSVISHRAPGHEGTPSCSRESDSRFVQTIVRCAVNFSRPTGIWYLGQKNNVSLSYIDLAWGDYYETFCHFHMCSFFTADQSFTRGGVCRRSGARSDF